MVSGINVHKAVLEIFIAKLKQMRVLRTAISDLYCTYTHTHTFQYIYIYIYIL